MSRTYSGVFALLCAAVLGLAGCSQGVTVSPAPGASASGEPTVGFTTFPDMPLPAKAEIDVNDTLIFGTGDGWFGRLVLTTSHSAGDVFNFYKESLPEFGWNEITSIRAAVSVLTYARDQRVATIQIQGRTMRGSGVSITVSPHGAPPAPAATAPMAPMQ